MKGRVEVVKTPSGFEISYLDVVCSDEVSVKFVVEACGKKLKIRGGGYRKGGIIAERRIATRCGKFAVVELSVTPRGGALEVLYATDSEAEKAAKELSVADLLFKIKRCI